MGYFRLPCFISSLPSPPCRPSSRGLLHLPTRRRTTRCGLAHAGAGPPSIPGQCLRPRPTRTSMRQSHPHVSPTQDANEQRLGRLIGSPAIVLSVSYLFRSILPSLCLSFSLTFFIVLACSVLCSPVQLSCIRLSLSLSLLPYASLSVRRDSQDAEGPWARFQEE